MRRDRKLWSSSSDELDEFDADPYPLLAGAYRSAGGEKNVVLERTRLLDRRVSGVVVIFAAATAAARPEPIPLQRRARCGLCAIWVLRTVPRVSTPAGRAL